MTAEKGEARPVQGARLAREDSQAQRTAHVDVPAILRGDARNLPLPDESVDLIITSPPYFGLRDYGTDEQIGAEATPAEFVSALIACTREMVRVLKPAGSIFVNLGDKYDKRKSLALLPERYRIAAVDELGLIARAVIVWSKPNGLPESVTDRVRRSHEDWVHLTKAPRYFAAVDEIRERYAPDASERRSRYKSPSASRYAPSDRNDADRKTSMGLGIIENPLGKLPGSVWEIAAQPLRVPKHLNVDHFAAFPMEWPRRLILGWSPPGGTVLDPFGGTGTTALVATMHGRVGISVDLSADYCRLAQWRCNDPKQRERATQAKVRPLREVVEPEPIIIRDPLLIAIEEALDRTALVELWRANRDVWTDDLHVAVKDRLAQIKENDEAVA